MSQDWSSKNIPKQVIYWINKIHEKIDLINAEFEYFYKYKYKYTLKTIDNLYAEIDGLKIIIKAMFYIMLCLIASNIYLLFRY